MLVYVDRVQAGFHLQIGDHGLIDPLTCCWSRMHYSRPVLSNVFLRDVPRMPWAYLNVFLCSAAFDTCTVGLKECLTTCFVRHANRTTPPNYDEYEYRQRSTLTWRSTAAWRASRWRHDTQARARQLCPQRSRWRRWRRFLTWSASSCLGHKKM